jgi:hypothetical protein
MKTYGGPPLEGDDAAGGGAPPASEALLLFEAEEEVVLEAVRTDAVGLYVGFFCPVIVVFAFFN